MTLLEVKQKYPNVEELIPDMLWVGYKLQDEDVGSWLDFCFYDLASADLERSDSTTEVDALMSGNGPSGSLRECRHTYWGEKDSIGMGYIFYPNFAHIRKMLDWLEKYYDGD